MIPPQETSFSATGQRLALCLAALAMVVGLGSGRAEAAETPRRSAFKAAVFYPPLKRFERGTPEADSFAKVIGRQSWGRRVEHFFFPADAQINPAGVRDAILALAGEEEIKVLILGGTPPGSLEGCAGLRAQRPDILMISLDPQTDHQLMSQTVSLTLGLNHASRGFFLPVMAKRMGASALIRFSSPRQLDMLPFAMQSQVLIRAAEDLGLTFLTADDCPDPAVAGRAEIEAYIAGTLDRYRQTYGDRIAFYGLDDAICEILTVQAIQNGGLALDPVYPSLYLGLPEALNLGRAAGDLNGQWKRLLALADERYLQLRPPGQISTWACPYPQTAIMAAIDLAVANIEKHTDLYDLKNINAVLEKYSPGEKWQVNLVVDHDGDYIVPQMVVLAADSYWFGHGYQGFPRLNIPNKLFRLK